MAKRFLDTLTSEQRKQYPMSGGLVDYFPDALAIISHVSWTGNEKHNPGQPLHHSRWISADHADCVMRHHSTRGNDEHGIPFMHMAEEGWRVLAMIQEAMEEYYGLDLPRGARAEPETLVCEKEEDIPGLTEAIDIPRTPPADGKMTMADYHNLHDACLEKSDCIIRAPRDAGVGREYIVQFTDPGTVNGIMRIVASDGPFKSFGAAENYARENPNSRLGLISICSLNPQEE